MNNADWLDEIKYLDFLRNYGRHFTINRMLAFESVKQRLAREQPLTFLEFNYMLLQSYVRILLHYCVVLCLRNELCIMCIYYLILQDFVELNRRFGTKLQLGGSDQWGNIVSGVELARKVDQAQVFGSGEH